MKKLQLLAVFCLTGLLAMGQPYGERLYPHASSFLSSGERTSIFFQGFLMAGYRGISVASTPNFYIDKTNQNGTITGANTFSREYSIWNGPSGCLPGQQNRVLNCVGVSAIESGMPASSSEQYVVVGAFDRGCFFSTLDMTSGAPVATMFYEFPAAATLAPTKPFVIRAGGAPATSMYYYICGTYEIPGTPSSTKYTYVIKVNNAGSILWSNTYNLGQGTSLKGLAMIESPYTSAGVYELVIVGSSTMPTVGSQPKGFFMKVNGLTGGLLSFARYGQAGGGGYDEFDAISRANSTTVGGVPGYIVGGYSDMNLISGTGTAWFLKLSATGGILWNSLFTPSMDPTAGRVFGVTERASATYGYEYFGVSYSASSGIIAMKLDDLGNAFTVFSPIDDFNTFVYNAGSGGASSIPCSISYKSTSSPNLGIQVYGTDNAFTGGNHYFVEAYFNGQEACFPVRDNLGATASGPPVIYNPNVNVVLGLNPCKNFALVSNAVNTTPVIICLNTSMSSGSNNKTAVATGIGEKNISSGQLSLFPNPSSGQVSIQYYAPNDCAVKFELYNNLGQFVKTIHEGQSQAGDQSLEFNFRSLGVESGIYMLNSNVNGITNQQKLVFIKE